MIRIMKEAYGPLRVIEGETFALVRPLLWKGKLVDSVCINYRVYTPNGIAECEAPSARLVAIAEEFRTQVEARLLGKDAKELALWVDTVEFDEKRD